MNSTGLGKKNYLNILINKLAVSDVKDRLVK